MDIDFSAITEKELNQLEAERKKLIPKAFIETIEHNEIFYELRFVYGFMHIGYLLIAPDGTKLELYVINTSEEKRIHLAFIGVLEEVRKKGLGHKYLGILTKLADKYGYDIDLEVEERFGMDQEVLRKFYSSHGFISETYDKNLTAFRKKSPILKECEGANSTNE